MKQSYHLGLIGFPVGHSRSPQMMKAAFEGMGLYGSTYQSLSIQREDLEKEWKVRLWEQWDGCNVTIPHKVAVLDLLDEIDETAKEIEAVNTIVNIDGKKIGYNTDGEGYLRSLEEELSLDITKQRVFIVGAGGAARAVATVLAKAGVTSITFYNRTTSKAEQLARHVSRWTDSQIVTQVDAWEAIQTSTLLVNTTSVGMAPNSECTPIPVQWLHDGLIVSDLIYNPRKTKLLTYAEEMGCQIHNGLGMLVHQAAIALKIWTGMDAPVVTMRDALEKSLKE